LDFLMFLLLLGSIAGVVMNKHLISIACGIIASFLLIMIRLSIPNGFKVLDAKLGKKFCPFIVSESRRAYPIPCNVDSGYAVFDKKYGTRVPIDWDSVVWWDGVPVMFLYRGSGKALNFKLIAFFDWLEKEYGIDPEDFKKVMKLALEEGKKIKTLDDFFAYQEELIQRGIKSIEEKEVVEDVKVEEKG